MTIRPWFCLLMVLAMLGLTLPALGTAEAVLVEEGSLPVTTLPVSVMSSQQSTVSVETAIQTASTALQQHHPGDTGILSVQFTCHTNRVRMSDSRTAWMISLFAQVGETPVECVVTLDDSTGALLRYEENNTGNFSLTQQRWEAAYGKYGTWPLDTQFSSMCCTVWM